MVFPNILKQAAQAAITALTLVVLIPGGAQSAQVTWIGGDGAWHDPAHWNTGAVPAATDDAIIDVATPVTVTVNNGASIATLTLDGHLLLATGNFTTTGAMSITGSLTIATGATLTADGTAATVTVTQEVQLDGGSVYALRGAQISLPGATRYRGPGVLQADGAGSRLELPNLATMGIEAAGPELAELTDAISREFTLFHKPAPLTGDDTPSKGITDAVSREFTVNVSSDTLPVDLLTVVRDAVSREFTLYHKPELAPGEDSPSKGIGDAVSREFTLYHKPTPVSGENGPALGINDAISREFTARLAAPTDSDLLAAIKGDTVSRAVAVYHQRPGEEQPLEQAISGDTVSRAVAVYHQRPGEEQPLEQAISGDTISRAVAVYHQRLGEDQPLELAISGDAVSRAVAVYHQAPLPPAPPAGAVLQHYEDFSLALSGEWTGITTLEPVAGYKNLGADGNVFYGNLLRNPSTGNPASKTTLKLSGLPTHDRLDLRFLLAVIDSWDGNTGSATPDVYTVTVDGTAIFAHTFDNGIQTDQSAPATNQLSWGQQRGFSTANDSAYTMGALPAFANIVHTASTLTIEFFAGGAGWQGGNDESWAIDNVEILLYDSANTNATTVVSTPQSRAATLKLFGWGQPDSN